MTIMDTINNAMQALFNRASDAAEKRDAAAKDGNKELADWFQKDVDDAYGDVDFLMEDLRKAVTEICDDYIKVPR